MAIVFFYVDDDNFMSTDKTLIVKAIKGLIQVGLKIEDWGYSTDYVGVNIK